MRVDLYTKIVLTVIAGCLMWMCVQGVPPASLQAQTAVQPVVITGLEKGVRGLPVQLVTDAGAPLATAEGVRVTIGNRAGQTIPVGVTSISRGVDAPWDSVQVEVTKVPPARVPGH
jgi:hypothetical protein